MRRIDQLKPYLPKLEYLSLNRVAWWSPGSTPSSWTGDLVNAIPLPNLRKIAWRWFPTILEEENEWEETAAPGLGNIAERLTTIVLGRHLSIASLDRFREVLGRTLSLERLTINSPELLEAYLDAVPSFLTSLQIGAHYLRRAPLRLDQHYLLPLLLNPPRSISFLERLCIPEVFMWGWMGRVRERTDPNQHW